MTEFTDWESYLYPETHDTAAGQGVLRNKFGERGFYELRALEYTATARRERELHAGVASIERTYGADHLRAIHGYLFQDVYEWAGQFRTVRMAKGTLDPNAPKPNAFANVRNGETQQLLDDVQEFVQSYDWSQLDRATVVNNTAVVFAFVNQAHPFREGNGRTSKMFMEHIVEQTPYTLDFSRIDPDLWNTACELSRPQPGREWIDPTPLLSVFHTAAVSRPTAGPAPTRAPHLDLSAVSYPSPATGRAGASAHVPEAQPYSGRGYGPSAPEAGR